jgi:DNA polymerase
VTDDSATGATDSATGATDSATGLTREEICYQLANWLRLMELSGTREVLWSSRDGILASLEPESSGSVDIGVATGPARDVPGRASGAQALEALRRRMASCTACELHKTRTTLVFGEGNPHGELVFIGEGPGRDEDLSGRPFVGRAGALLTKIIGAMGLKREDVYIANIVKCRPPGNRNPEPDEIMECLPFLEEQVDLIGPKVICSLGNVATQTLTGERDGITRMRGRSYEYRGIRMIPTFHPAACLRNPGIKKDVWEDIQKIMKILGLTAGGMKDGAGKSKR